MKIGVLGSGVVGRTLANGFLKHGHQVMIGTNDAAKRAELAAATGGKALTGGFAETAAFGEAVVLAVKGAAAEAAVSSAGLENLAGKTVLDATNPIAETPPVNGVLSFFTGPNESLMERLQKRAPKARFVKAFSCIGNGLMINPDFGGVKPTMFICGDSGEAKDAARRILDQFGFETQDMGGVEAARAIEPLCMLWCLPGFRNNQWTHAFKMLTK